MHYHMCDVKDSHCANRYIVMNEAEFVWACAACVSVGLILGIIITLAATAGGGIA